MKLPENAIMLMSYVNTQLRDNYDSFDALCDDMEYDKDMILSKLEDAGFIYNEGLNKFMPKDLR